MTQTITSYSLPPSQRLYLIGLGVLLGLLQLINDNPVVGALVFVLSIGAFFIQAQFRTEISEEGVRTLGNLFGRRAARWEEISTIEDSSLLGTRSVRVTRHDGSKFRLPAPVDGPMMADPEYETKVAAIQEEWQRRTASSAPDGAAGVDPQ